MSAETGAMWIREILSEAGIDTSKFKEHITHHALAAWLRKTKAITVALICRKADLSKLTSTFRKFYHRVVLQWDINSENPSKTM